MELKPKAGTCAACTRAISQDVRRYAGEEWEWRANPEGPALCWAALAYDPPATLYVTACGRTFDGRG
jgi:hypothetical protein